MRRTLATLAVGALVVGACGGTSTDTDGPLIVYSGRAEELVQPLIDDFTEATGVEVIVRYAGSTELAATLLEEAESSDADIFYAQDPASLGAVTALLAPLPDEILSLVDARFADREGRWVGVSGRVRVLAVNTESGVAAPDSIDEVVDGRYQGKLGIAPTNGSFLAFVSAMILDRGEEATLDWLRRLAASDPVDFPGNSPVLEAVASGEIDAGLINHYYLYQLKAEGGGDTAENHFLTAGDPGTLVMPSGVGIVATSDHPDAAAQLVEFLLSDRAQQFFAEETYEYPLIAGVSPVDGLPPLSSLNALDIDLSSLASVLERATQLVAEAGLV